MSQNRISIIDLTRDSPKRPTQLPERDLMSSARSSLSNTSICGDLEAIIARTSCPICFQIWPVNNVSATKCGHVFCTACITSVLKVRQNCPMCNKNLKLTELIKLFI